MKHLENLNKARELIAEVLAVNIAMSKDIGTEEKTNWYRMLVHSQGFLKDSIIMYKKENEKRKL